MELILDADRVGLHGRLPAEDYVRFSAWVDAVIKERGYVKALGVIKKTLGVSWRTR